jgi:flagellar M-ring protein FliF
MVDGLSTTDASGQNQWAPRPEEELAALHDLVAAAVGFDSARGDVITIKTLAFEPQPVEGSGPASSLIPPFALDVMTLIQLGVLALVTLVLGLFVLRPILASRSARPGATATLAAPAAASGPVLNGIIEDDEIMPDIRPQRPSARVGDGGQKGDGEISDPVARLRRLINERQDETVEILRSWMDDPETEKS